MGELDDIRREADQRTERWLVISALVVTAMTLLGFLIAFWDKGALNMGVGCGIVAAILWGALLWPIKPAGRQ